MRLTGVRGGFKSLLQRVKTKLEVYIIILLIHILVPDTYILSPEETLEHKINKTKTRNTHAGRCARIPTRACAENRTHHGRKKKKKSLLYEFDTSGIGRTEAP